VSAPAVVLLLGCCVGCVSRGVAFFSFNFGGLRLQPVLGMTGSQLTVSVYVDNHSFVDEVDNTARGEGEAVAPDTNPVLKMTDWKCERTGWKMTLPGVEIRPLGAMPADYIIGAVGIVTASNATQRFLSCVPQQVRLILVL
jgi:hypothetical protein